MEAALTEVKPALSGAAIGLTALAPREDRIAYAVVRPTQAIIEVAFMSSDAPLRLAALPYPPRVLAWSPDAAHLAWLSGGPAAHVGGDRVGFCSVSEPTEIHTVRGQAVSWLSSEELAIADAAQGEIVVLDTAGRRRRALALSDDGHARHRPRIAIAGDGRIAYSTRCAEDQMCAVWIAEGDTVELVTEVPGARCWVMPFFSPDDRVLGMLIVHPPAKTSGIVLLNDVHSMEGCIVYESVLTDVPETPVWCDAGIVFLRSSEPRAVGANVGPPILTRLDPESQELHALCEPGTLSGALHVRGSDVLVDAQRAAWRLSWR